MLFNLVLILINFADALFNNMADLIVKQKPPSIFTKRFLHNTVKSIFKRMIFQPFGKVHDKLEDEVPELQR